MRIVTALLILILPLQVFADVKQQEAIAAMRAGEHERAMEMFSVLAEQGDRLAMNTIGIFYYEGQGVEQNYSAAMDWWMRALPDADALVNIGVLYRDGLGVDQNLEMAYAVFVIVYATSQGSQSTQYRNGGNLMKAVDAMSQEQIDAALCYSVERVMRFIESRGTDSNAGGVAIIDKDWWLEGELPDVDCGKVAG